MEDVINLHQPQPPGTGQAFEDGGSRLVGALFFSTGGDAPIRSVGSVLTVARRDEVGEAKRGWEASRGRRGEGGEVRTSHSGTKAKSK